MNDRLVHLHRPCFIICGTKVDLRQNSQRSQPTGNEASFVDLFSAKELAKVTKAAGPIECSSKEDYNVHQDFVEADKYVVSSRRIIVDRCKIL